jgi:hypothetical protein
MALLFCDSFDHYTTVLEKWSSVVTMSISSGNGRNGTASIRGSNSYQRSVTKSLGVTVASLIVGVAYRTSDYSGISTGNQVISLLDSGSLQLEVRILTTGRLRITRNGTTLGTGTTVLTPSVFYYIELKATINNSTGSAVLRINGTTELNLSGIDTQNTANATVDTLQLGGGLNEGGVFNMDFDDLYVSDTTGSSPTNDFLGDTRIEAIFPNGNGNSSQLVGSDSNSTDNYLLVDETAPNSDTDYVESSTVGDKDTYAMGNLTSTTGTVYGVQVMPYAKKTDAGVRSIVSVARLSSTEVDSAAKTLSTTYAYLPDIREAKPGGGAWSISDVNSAEFGVKVNA